MKPPGENKMKQYKPLYKNLFGIGAVVFCCLLLSPSLRLLPVGAQTPSVTDTSRDPFEPKITLFFSTLQKGNISTAFDELLRSGPLSTAATSTPALELQTRVDEMQTQFGNIRSWERFDSKQVGTYVTLVRYVLLYDNYPVIWTFTFYRKPSSASSISASTPTWEVVELHCDTNMNNPH
jgi:hypothetical protein